ncbi:hypothetical protein BaRGS_00021245 [Batillaria attramentaria]|uniref:Secreted protein n=1 Tax=Batillaria attramentaria TaxID=370345 RepID=A0ABD0KKA0_9CAEN
MLLWVTAIHASFATLNGTRETKCTLSDGTYLFSSWKFSQVRPTTGSEVGAGDVTAATKTTPELCATFPSLGNSNLSTPAGPSLLASAARAPGKRACPLATN